MQNKWSDYSLTQNIVVCVAAAFLALLVLVTIVGGSGDGCRPGRETTAADCGYE